MRADNKKYLKLTPPLFYTYSAFVIAYACLTLIPSPQKAILLKYHLSPLGLRLIYLTIVGLIIFIWLAGFYAYSRLNLYSQLISDEKDGRHVVTMKRGILLLALWLPITSTLSAIFNLISTKHPGALASTTIISNYLSLLIPMAGFILIGFGSHGLSQLTKRRPSYRIAQLLTILPIYIGIAYIRLVASTSHRVQIYHLSLWLIALTLVAPYIYMWWLGLITAFEIYHYQQKIKGVVYRRSWKLLAGGLTWLIVASIAFEYLDTLAPRLQNLSIYWLLVIVYSLLLILSGGFVLIAAGSSKLQKIEEV